jgi:general nucleoside transport system ATP-binding protein
VLTPHEAQEVLSAVKALAQQGRASVILITHKFHEVETYADEVTVLRKGKKVGHGLVREIDRAQMARWMIGEMADAASEATAPNPLQPTSAAQPSQSGDLQVAALTLVNLTVRHDRAGIAVDGQSLTLHAGEILGIAGVSGNGQRELIQALSGQRELEGGEIRLQGQPYRPYQSGWLPHAAAQGTASLRVLPEEPSANACVGNMSVAHNLALRNFRHAPLSRKGWLRPAAIRAQALTRIQNFKIATQGADAPISTLSGGNVQRAVLARELSDDCAVLVVMNPVFGLDFSAVKEIHQRLNDARARGCAILLVSEDLDELLELSTRLLVMVKGRFVYETHQPAADRSKIGEMMGTS